MNYNKFITYKQAKQLKVLGFNDPCFSFFIDVDEFIYTNQKCLNYNLNNKRISAPIKQDAFKWFRDEHNLLHEIISVQKESWLITIKDTTSTTERGVYNGKQWNCDDLNTNIPKTYEQAELACIDKLIEIIKNSL